MAAPTKERLSELVEQFDAQAGRSGPPRAVFKALSDVYEAGRRAKLWSGPKFCTCNPSKWREFSAHVHRILGN